MLFDSLDTEGRDLLDIYQIRKYLEQSSVDKSPIYLLEKDIRQCLNEMASLTKAYCVKRSEFEIPQDIKGNFVLTDEARERLQKIKNFFDSKIPIILEGPTGTSKTKTIQVLCNITGRKLIRFNLSSETTIEDLIGRLGSSEKESWSSFQFVPGPFTEAFEKGYVLLRHLEIASKDMEVDLEMNFEDMKGKVDLSDKNPVVYCLKSAKKYNMDQVKEYLLKSQIPEYKEELKINDDMFSWCIEELSRDN